MRTTLTFGVALVFIAGCGDDDAVSRRDAGAAVPRDAGSTVGRDAGADLDASTTPSPDAAIGTDAGSTSSAPLALTARDVAITPVGSTRVPDVAYDAARDAYVVVYTWVLPGPEFRTEARVVTVDAAGAPVVSPPVTVDALATPAHNSAEAAVAVPDASSSAPALVVWSDDRLSGGSGQLEIYGQFLRVTGGATPSAALEGGPIRISNIDVTGEVLPAVVWTGSGYYVAWGDDRERGVRDTDARVVFGRTVALDGALGPETRLGDDTLFQTYPQLVRCGDRVLAAWTDYRAPGGPLVIQYRGRILDAATGAPVSAVVPIAPDAMVSPDPPGVTCDPRAGVWYATWPGPGPPSIKQIYLASVSRDGIASAPVNVTMQPDGALAPRLTWVSATGTLALSYHSQETTFAYVVELTSAGTARGSVATLTDSAPSLGTFWTSIAAHTTRAEVLVATTLDYNRVAVSVLRATP